MSFSLSYSKLQCFAQCPLKYKLQFLDKVPTKPSKALFLGSAVHEAISEFLKTEYAGEVQLPENFAGDVFRQVWRKHKIAATGRQEYPFTRDEEIEFGKAGIVLVENFVMSPYNFKPYWNEQMVKKDILGGKVTFWGKVDRVDQVEGRYRVVDYKTGKYNEKYADQFQLGVYAWMCSGEGVQIESAAYYFLEPNMDVTYSLSSEMCAEVLSSIERRSSEVICALEGGSLEPTPSALCPWCDFISMCPAQKTSF